MSDKEIVVVVLGYGCHLGNRMKAYIDQVIAFVKTNPVTAIMTTGGFTNRQSAPGVSEAGMMAEYLKKRGITIPIWLDEDALTSCDNLRGIVRFSQAHKMTDKQFVIFCDEARKVKIQMLARLILPSSLSSKIIAYPLTHGLIPKIKQTLVAMPLDILASQSETFERLQKARKEHIMNNS